MTSSPPAGLDDREALLGSVLPNGRSVTVITPTRIGFASCRGVDLTRWRGDFKAVSDGWFINLRDMESAERWSVSPQPPPVSKPGATKPHPAPALVSSTLGWRTIETPLEVCVATDDVELRRLTRKNRSGPLRCPDATGHVEVMFNHPAADAAPPAFPKLFVQTEWVAGRELLRCETWSDAKRASRVVPGSLSAGRVFEENMQGPRKGVESYMVAPFCQAVGADVETVENAAIHSDSC